MRVARVTVLALVLLGGCVTDAQRKAAENAAIQREAAQEVTRICALPAVERAVELERIEAESGIIVYCGED